MMSGSVKTATAVTEEKHDMIEMADTDKFNQDNWKLTFSTLLNIPVTDLDFTLTITDKIITITSKDKDNLKKLEDIFDSPEQAYASINYRLCETGKTQAETMPLIHYPDLMETEPGKGLTLLQKVFGDETIKKIGTNVTWTEDLTGENTNLLATELVKSADKLTDAQFEAYQTVLGNASYADLRKALAADESKYAPIPYETSAVKQGILRPHMNKILFTKTTAAGQRKYFDYGLLLASLRVKAQMTELVDDLYEFKIDISNFIKYLNLIFKEGFLLNINQNPDSGAHEARPISFNAQSGIQIDNLISLVLDCSGSMAENFENFKKMILEFIQRIYTTKNAQGTIIRIAPFSDQLLPAGEFIVDAHSYQAITDFVNGLHADGGTLLRGAILAELATIGKNHPGKNINILPFTDGADNFPEMQKEFVAAISELGNDIAFRSLTAYTIGYGNNYQESHFEGLAALTGGKHQHLTELNTLNNVIAQHFNKMFNAKAWLLFIQEQIKFSLFTYENQISSSIETLKVPGNFTAAGKSYTADLGGVKLIAAPEEKLEVIATPSTIKLLTAKDIEAYANSASDEQIETLLKLLAQNKAAVVTPPLATFFSSSVPGNTLFSKKEITPESTATTVFEQEAQTGLKIN